MATNYLKKILSARVYDVARETELQLAPELSKRLGNQVLLKREDNQPVFSFKLRGAYNKMAHLSPEALKRGVIAASAGNHAQGVALSAAKMKCKAVIVMPVTTPSLKIDAVKARGGSWVEVILHGESYSDAFKYSELLEKKRGLTFVHPFDDPDVIAGQGTIAQEIFQQYQEPIDAVFVAIGGGGLISGIGEYVKAVSPKTKVIGVQASDSDAMNRSLKANKRIEMKDVGLFSDGTAVRLVGEETFRLAREVVDPVFAVPGGFAAPDAWLALYAYAVQIYCDFSAYADIAIGISLLQATALTFIFGNGNGNAFFGAAQRLPQNVKLLPDGMWPRGYLVIMTLVGGTALLMWLGELISQRGIGNGMSMIIFASVVAGMPSGYYAIWQVNKEFWLIGLIILTLGIIHTSKNAITLAAFFTGNCNNRTLHHGL